MRASVIVDPVYKVRGGPLWCTQGTNIYLIEMAERYRCVITNNRRTYYEDGKSIARGKIPAAIVPLIPCLKRGDSVASREPVTDNISRLLTLPRELQIETLIYLPLDEIVVLAFTVPGLAWILESNLLWQCLLQMEDVRKPNYRAIQASHSPAEMFFYLAIRGARKNKFGYYTRQIPDKLLHRVDTIMYSILWEEEEKPYDHEVAKLKRDYYTRSLYVAAVSLVYYSYLVGKRYTAEGILRIGLSS